MNKRQSLFEGGNLDEEDDKGSSSSIFRKIKVAKPAKQLRTRQTEEDLPEQAPPPQESRRGKTIEQIAVSWQS